MALHNVYSCCHGGPWDTLPFLQTLLRACNLSATRHHPLHLAPEQYRVYSNHKSHNVFLCNKSETHKSFVLLLYIVLKYWCCSKEGNFGHIWVWAERHLTPFRCQRNLDGNHRPSIIQAPWSTNDSLSMWHLISAPCSVQGLEAEEAVKVHRRKCWRG